VRLKEVVDDFKEIMPLVRVIPPCRVTATLQQRRAASASHRFGLQSLQMPSRGRAGDGTLMHCLEDGMGGGEGAVTFQNARGGWLK
jgi:hypothetical protein